MPLTCGEWGPSFDSKKWSNKLFTVNDQRDCSPEESCMFGSFLHLGQKVSLRLCLWLKCGLCVPAWSNSLPGQSQSSAALL